MIIWSVLSLIAMAGVVVWISLTGRWKTDR